MLYDLGNELSRQQFAARAAHLMEGGSIVELTEKRQRTGSQNRYLHVILGLLAIETGNTLEYVKRNYYKYVCNRELFLASKHDQMLGRDVSYLRSSRDLTKEEMSLSIDRFRTWAAQQGYYLPSPEDEALVAQAELEVERNRRWL